MIIGATSSSISKTEIFSKYSEAQVLKAVFPEIISLPCRIHSPFRVDKNPSFSLYVSNNHHIKFKDHGDSDCKGNLLDLLCKYWNCSFQQVFDKIIALMQEKDTGEVQLKSKQIKLFTRKEVSELTKIQVAVRPWRDYDYEYWKSYGVEPKWLHYAKVYPISHKIVTKKEHPQDRGKRFIFPADKYAYVFTEKKEGVLSLKIYQPFNTKGFKWCSQMDASVISLWTKVPETGDRIVICSSLKDALCLMSQLGIPAIAPQGEGYNISETACKELRKRFKQVFICFDTDSPGKADSEKLAEKTGFKNVVPDLGKEKDLSDFFKSLQDKTKFKELEKLFH